MATGLAAGPYLRTGSVSNLGLSSWVTQPPLRRAGEAALFFVFVLPAQ